MSTHGTHTHDTYTRRIIWYIYATHTHTRSGPISLISGVIRQTQRAPIISRLYHREAKKKKHPIVSFSGQLASTRWRRACVRACVRPKPLAGRKNAQRILHETLTASYGFNDIFNVMKKKKKKVGSLLCHLYIRAPQQQRSANPPHAHARVGTIDRSKTRWKDTRFGTTRSPRRTGNYVTLHPSFPTA